MKLANKIKFIKFSLKLATFCGQLFIFSYKCLALESLPTCASHPELAREHCLKEWSVLIYMAADNDLTPYALWDIYEMEKKFSGENNFGASGPNTDVIVELDTLGNKGVSLYHIEQSDEFYNPEIDLDYFQGNDESMINSPRLAQFNEDVPTTAEAQLNHFLKFSYKNFPSKKVLLVIWGHGEGFIGAHQSNPQLSGQEENVDQAVPLLLEREMVALDKLSYSNLSYINPFKKVFGGVAFDHTDMTFLDIPTISKVLKDSSEEFRKSRAVDILAFDACLMQSFEVAMTVKNQAQFLVGSNQIQSYMGLPYHLLLDHLNEFNPSSFNFAKTIPYLVEQGHNSELSKMKFDHNESQTFTASTLSLSELNFVLLPALDELRKSIIAYVSERPTREIDLRFILENSPTFRGESRDIGIFVGTVLKLLYQEKQNGGETEISKTLGQSCNKALDALNRTALSFTYGEIYSDPKALGLTLKNNYLLGFLKGISIWLPSKESLYLQRKVEFKDFPLLFKPSVWK